MTNARLLIAAFCLMAFFTADAATAFRFVAWADTKSGTSTLKTESLAVDSLNPAFTIFPGDLCDSGPNAGCFTTWKKAFNGDNTNNLFDKTFATRGNHDSSGGSYWKSVFDFASVASNVGATNYVEQATDMTYSFDYGNSHFVGIDLPGGGVTSMSVAQRNWLDSDLAAAESRGLTHAFLFWHGPVYTLDGHCCEVASSSLVNVLNNHPIVSAGFFGHEHVVAYTHIDSSRISGVTHEFEEFVSGDAGAGPKTISSGRADGWLRSDGVWATSGSRNTAHGFMSVDVNGNDYTVSVHKTDGTVVKTFSFSKIVGTTVSTPTFSPPGGSYPTAQNVAITTATSGATIHYTDDGTTPLESSPTYSPTLTVSSTKTLKAKAWKAGFSPSATAVATYTIGASPDTIPPSPITNLAAGNPSSSTVRLIWTSPGDDANTGTASEYDIRYSTAPITVASWGSAVQAPGNPMPKTAGSHESFTVTGLSSSTNYYFAVKTSDEVPNWSGISNVPSATTLSTSVYPTDCIPCAICNRFEKWKAVCALISQSCTANGLGNGFCTGQESSCELKVDDLIERCHAISCEGYCS